MPIYEYKCLNCGRKNEFITFRVSETIDSMRCRYCGGEGLKKLVSRVRIRLSEETRIEKLSDPSKWGGLDEEDPKSVSRFMKRMGRELGDVAENEDMDAIIEESLETGFEEDQPETSEAAE